MRYYSIEIKGVDGNPLSPSSLNGNKISSLIPGTSYANPAALNIELDLPVFAYHTPDGNAMLRIWGLGLADIGQAYNLNPDPQTGQPTAIITVNAGMSPGLPLATAAANQAGPLVVGSVLQAYGNWVGTDQTVDIQLTPYTGTNEKPLNYTLDWKAGQPLSEALMNCFNAALPKASTTVRISSRLTQTHDEPMVHGTLEQLSQTIYTLSKTIIKDANYSGVWISYDGVNVNVQDQTNPTAPKKIAFQDLIGQPNSGSIFV